jgi:MSHA biogenesis protein MshP
VRRRALAAPRCAQCGFSIIVAIFVIVVLAALAAFAVRIAAMQQQTVDFGLLNARAQSAAASGIEYGANQALMAGSCPPPTATPPLLAAGLAGFSVTVTCSPSMHTVSGATYWSYVLTAVAQHGAYGNPDFVQSTQTRSVNNAPP